MGFGGPQRATKRAADPHACPASAWTVSARLTNEAVRHQSAQALMALAPLESVTQPPIDADERDAWKFSLVYSPAESPFSQ